MNREDILTERIFSFEDPILPLTRGHILREKPPSSGYQPHPSDVSSLQDAQELQLTDFTNIATGFEGYIFPPTLNRSAIATLLIDCTPGGMKLFNVSGGRGYDDSVPGEVTKIAPFGDRTT